MREFLGERSEHKVSRYELPAALKRKMIDRLKPYIDRFGYRDAVDAALRCEPAPKAPRPGRRSVLAFPTYRDCCSCGTSRGPLPPIVLLRVEAAVKLRYAA